MHIIHGVRYPFRRLADGKSAFGTLKEGEFAFDAIVVQVDIRRALRGAFPQHKGRPKARPSKGEERGLRREKLPRLARSGE